jgi:hypothetical protein
MLTSGIPNQITVQNGIGGNSVIPATGYYGTSWPAKSGSVIPQGLGGGGWTIDPTTPNTYDRGYPQQTFLGASIRNFSMNGGFGDSSSSLSMDLINDEFNNSDKTAQGQGDDVYHSGNGDRFVPPIAGTPVYFKFGPNLATVEQAYRKTFDQTYGFDTIGTRTVSGGGTFDKNNFTSLSPNQYVNLETNQIWDFTSYVTNSLTRGADHIVFGGILQSYMQNRGPGGNPLYSVQVTDPREILSNVILVLNNYAGTTFNTQNVFNIHGFLEYNMTPALSGILQRNFPNYNILTKYVNPTNGYISYSGSMSATSPVDCWLASAGGMFGSTESSFPVTGTGFSRRGPQGIPFYRIKQAIGALMSLEYTLPAEYENMGFGKVINFRGYNYVVDFSGLPNLPPMYFLDFDQINLLDLALEVCDVTSRDLFVSLLPVINHPACQFLYDNQNADPKKLIAGIIRLDSIDRSHAPVYGAIKTYIDSLASSGILVENQDVGYELSNVTTDKFVVGAQEVDMYCFSANADRDFINARNRRSGGESDDADWKQWTLEKQLEQQVLPYYGTLGQNAITIPKGWGAYQQILLDTTGLNANGVGSYYVATEMELRCASISYDCWKNFLQQYNDTYLESIEGDDGIEGSALNQTASFGGISEPTNISNNYAVTVPRSVFETYSDTPFGTDKLPKSPCNPPYGYPLYYKRMTKLGIPEGGLTRLQSRVTGMITGAATMRDSNADNYQEIRNNQLKELEYIAEEYGTLTQAEKNYYAAISGALMSSQPDIDLLNGAEEALHSIGATLPRLAKKGTENALKVYEFLKKVADENLGKKFLVKIPNKVNLFHENQITWKGGSTAGEYAFGPFGFKPRPSTSGIGDEFSPAFLGQYRGDRDSGKNMIKYFLNSGIDDKQAKYNGALRTNYNPISDKYEFNYTPTNLGGYFPFDLYANTLTIDQISRLPENAIPKAVNQALIPQDLTNFLDENGRMSAYVRFDNSQHLALGSMNSEDFTQQLITLQGMVPDLCEFLDNVGEDKWTSFNEADSDRPDNNPHAPKQCAFVKCSVDEKFYMPPKMITSGIQTYGQVGEGDYKKKVSRPRKIFIPCSGITYVTDPPKLIPGTGVNVDSFRYIEKNYYPNTEAGPTANRLIFGKKYEPVLSSYIIKSDMADLDTSNVYALITLPNKVIPTKDARYRDSANQKDNTYDIKHYLTVDVVKGLPEFTQPAFAKAASETNILAGDTTCSTYSAEARSVAWLAAKKAKSSLQFGFPQQIQNNAPSPVYPDLVVIPMISNERCYGPWVSSQVDPQGSAYVNIGGRVEFIKDENLSPWNYAGYELMHSAGMLQAQFSNSLLLFSERGGFTYPGMPTTSLCQVLLSGGPLVTNVSVDVSEGGIKTTYKMDLYTASFGKLQKQKQDMISKISRERQRLRDERNALIRKGIGKGQTSINIVGSVNLFGNNGMVPTAPRAMNHIVASVARYESQSYSPTLGNVNGLDNIYAASMQNQQDIFDTANKFDSDNQRQSAEYNAGSVAFDEMFIPFSNEPYHPNMPNVRYTDYRANNRLYETGETTINDDDITLPT